MCVYFPLAILTLCMTSSSKDVERELPIWSSRSCGNVSRRYFFFLSEPHVVYTCRNLMAWQAISDYVHRLPHRRPQQEAAVAACWERR